MHTEIKSLMKKLLRSFSLVTVFVLTFSMISFAESFEVIQKNPEQKYYTGSIINLNDFEFVFEGETVDQSQIMVHGFDSSTPGYKSVTFTYKGFSNVLTIAVEEMGELKVIPKDSSYPVGYTLLTNDFIVSIGNRAITSFSIYPSKVSSIGNNSILITAESKTTSVDIYGEDSSFSLSIGGTYKTEFFQNEDISTKGVIVNKIDSKGIVTNVTAESIFELPNSKEIGEHIVTATYKGVTVTYRITIKESTYKGMDIEMLSVDGTVKLLFEDGAEEAVYPHIGEDLESNVKVITATDSKGNTYTEVVPLPEKEVIKGKKSKNIILQVPIGLNVTTSRSILNPLRDIEFKNGSQLFVKVHSTFREMIAGIQSFILEFRIGESTQSELQLERIDTSSFYLPIDSELEVSHE